MSHRFFQPELRPGPLVLDGDQAHHAIQVMRVQPGTNIEIFDGKGNYGMAEIESTSKKKLNLVLHSTNRSPPLSLPHTTVAVALPKGDRQRFLVEKLVELGVDQMVPLKTERSVAAAPVKVIARLEKQVIEACKQCGRNWLMHIEPETSIGELMEQTPDDATRLLADPQADQSMHDYSINRSLVVAVGPEGGFSPAEHEQFVSAGWQRVSLGEHVLRIETAAAAAAILAKSRIQQP